MAAVWFSATPSSIIFTLVAWKFPAWPAALRWCEQLAELLEPPVPVPPQRADHAGQRGCPACVARR